jgi:hypothetical protein
VSDRAGHRGFSGRGLQPPSGAVVPFPLTV